jgi:hypothetical protein
MDVLTWLRAQWDRVLGFALVAAGAVALVIGYDKAASTRYLAEQITVLISGGLGGVFCLGAGATLLVCADIRDEWRKLDRIEMVLRHMSDALGLPPPPDQPEPHTPAAESQAAVPPTPATVSVLTMIVGLALVIAGWQSSASTTSGSSALRAAGWSAAGVVLAGVGAAALIILSKRSVRLRESAVLGPVVAYGLSLGAGPDPVPPSGQAPAGAVLFAAGLRHFHRPGCAALAGVATDSCPRADAAVRLAPCPLCEP